MSKFIESLEFCPTGKRIPIMPSLSMVTDLKQAGPDLPRAAKEYSCRVRWEVMAVIEDYNPSRLRAIMTNVRARLIEDVYGDLRRILFELASAVYFREDEKALDLIRELKLETNT